MNIFGSLISFNFSLNVGSIIVCDICSAFNFLIRFVFLFFIILCCCYNLVRFNTDFNSFILCSLSYSNLHIHYIVLQIVSIHSGCIGAFAYLTLNSQSCFFLYVRHSDRMCVFDMCFFFSFCSFPQ